jgi:cytochrome c2
MTARRSISIRSAPRPVGRTLPGAMDSSDRFWRAPLATPRSRMRCPSLKGVFGRKSGAIEDFRYSGAMKRANLVWDEANLRDYISDPQAKVKGNRMPFGGLHDKNDVDDLIAYLKTFK